MKMLKVLGKILSTCLAAAILLTAASCSDTSWAVKAGNKTVPAGVYLGFLTDGYLSASYSVTDQETDLFKQKIGDVDAATYIKNEAIESSKMYLAVEQLFDDYKLSFTEEEQKELDTNIENNWKSYSAYYEENGCGKESFRKTETMREKYQKIFEYYYGENGKKPVSEAERKQYFSENYAKLKYFTVSYSAHFSGVSTAASATDAQKAELKELVEGYISRLNKGESFDKISHEEADYSATEEHEHDHDHEVEESEPTFITKDTSEEPSAFNKAVFAAKAGVPTMVENGTSGYYVFVRYDTDASGKDYTDRADSVLSSMKSEDFTKIVEEYTKKMKFTENKSAIKRYKPQNVNIAF